MEYINSGAKVSSYEANTYKPLRLGEDFYFKGRRCFVTEIYTNGFKYEYRNIGLRNGSRLHGFMWMDWLYVEANGTKPFSHWQIK